MALFQWIAEGEREALEERLQHSIGQVGLEIDPEFSSHAGIYARDRDGLRCAPNARVTIIISPTNGMGNEFQVEVRSSEPMLMRGTRCEEVANIVKTAIPAKS